MQRCTRSRGIRIGGLTLALAVGLTTLGAAPAVPDQAETRSPGLTAPVVSGSTASMGGGLRSPC